jgi:hypothetical protein
VEPPFGPIYNFSQNELVILHEYIDNFFENGFIQHSKFLVGALILFVKKKDGSLLTCVDCRGSNQFIVKNQYPLPLITNLWD